MPLIAFAALAAAHLFDFVSFIVMTGRHGIAAELNPIVVALAEGYGLPGLTVAKIAAVLLLGSVFLVLAPQRRRLASSVMLIGIAAGVLGGISNLATT